jgi:hypothetical protein
MINLNTLVKKSSSRTEPDHNTQEPVQEITYFAAAKPLCLTTTATKTMLGLNHKYNTPRLNLAQGHDPSTMTTPPKAYNNSQIKQRANSSNLPTPRKINFNAPGLASESACNNITAQINDIRKLVRTTTNQFQFSVAADLVNRPQPSELLHRYQKLHLELNQALPISESAQGRCNQRILNFCQLGIELCKQPRFNYEHWSEYMTFALRTIIGGNPKEVLENYKAQVVVPEYDSNSPFAKFLTATFIQNISSGNAYPLDPSSMFNPIGGRKYEQFQTKHGNSIEIAKTLALKLQPKLTMAKAQIAVIEECNHAVVLLSSAKINLDSTLTFEELKQLKDNDIYIIDPWLSLINPQHLNLSLEQSSEHSQYGFIGSLYDYEKLLQANLNNLFSPTTTSEFRFNFTPNFFADEV